MTPGRRQEVLALFQEQVRRVLGADRPTRWVDARTTVGDFEGRDETIEVFDVESEKEWELFATLDSLATELETADSVRVGIVFHTPAATTEHYSWARSELQAKHVEDAVRAIAVFAGAPVVTYSLSGAALGEEVLSATPLITAGCYTFHRDCDDSNFVPVNVPSAAICSEVLANAKAGP